MTIEIVRAIYGTNEKNIDVTSTIKNCTKTEIRNSLFGIDPHPWTRKYLKLEYTKDGKTYNSTLEEYDIFDINTLIKKKFLCICEGGNVRSVSLAHSLKDYFHQDALAASWRNNSSETLENLCKWADYIVVMQTIFSEKIPKSYKAKIRIADVGPDRFGNPFHPDLKNILTPIVEGWYQRSFEF